MISAPVPAKRSTLGSINTQSCLLTAYFEIHGLILPVVVDTGATISCIPENGMLMKRFKLKVLPANVNVMLGDNTTTHIDKKVCVPVKPMGSTLQSKTTTFYLHSKDENILGYEALIGLTSLKLFDLDIRFQNDAARMFHQGRLISHEESIDHTVKFSIRVDDRHLWASNDKIIANTLRQYKSVFTDLGREPLRGTPMRILTTHNRPICAKLRHYNPEEVKQIKEHIEDLLNRGIIEPTYSGYAATSRIIPKRNGTGRLVVNYIPLNAVTLRDSYALPHVSDIFGVLQGQKYFSTMDCTQGFYQVQVDRRDRHKTAFSTPLGNFQFVRCPFGARNSCAVLNLK